MLVRDLFSANGAHRFTPPRALLTTTEAPAGYRLGDPIALEDLLALPPDGRRYTRDDQGRLALMAPDRARAHRYPMGELHERLVRTRPPGWKVLQEPSVAFEPIHDLQGEVVPPSRLGLRTLEPELALYAERPSLVLQDPRGRNDVFAPDGLALVVELLSPTTFRSDLGWGAGREVDRWRTYLANEVPEYWLLNAGLEPAGLPPRSGLFLSNDGRGAWRALTATRATLAPGETIQGASPLAAGIVRSRAAPWLTVDLAALWAELDRLPPPRED